MVCQYPFCLMFSVLYQATAWEVMRPSMPHAVPGARPAVMIE
jgi:hypothetical protein